MRRSFSLAALAGILALALIGVAPSFAQPVQHSGGAVTVYDGARAPLLKPMAMPPVSQAYLNSQRVPVLPRLGPGQAAAAPAPQPAPWPVVAPIPVHSPVAAPAPATPWPLNQNPYWTGQPISQPLYSPAQAATGGAQAQAAAINDATDPYVDGLYVIKKDYLLSWPKNAWGILSAPVRWDRQEWLVAGSILGITGALFLLDKEIRNFVQGDVRSSGTDDFFDAVEPLGDFDYMLAGSIGAYAISELFSAKREKAASLMLFQTVAIAGGLGEGMKRLTGRTRPEGTRSNPDPDTLDFKGFDSGDNDSFPSGHAIVAFATATVISETYASTSPWVPWVAYPLATSVGLARIHENRHWASDVFLGGALGHFIAKFIVANNPFLRRNNMMVRPLDVKGGRGFSVSMKY